MTMRIKQRARQGAATLLMALLASCVTPPPKAVRPVAPPPAAALPAAPPQQDWRDVALTHGTWHWRGEQGIKSISVYGEPGQPALFAMRCDLEHRAILFSRAGRLAAPQAVVSFTTSYGVFSLPAANGDGQPPAIVSQASARDPRMDQLAFSRGRFLVDVPGQERLVLPSWPEVGRVIEDCRF